MFLPNISELLNNQDLLLEADKKRIELINGLNEENIKSSKKRVIEFLKAGFLNKNELIFLDIETEKFCIYNLLKDKILRLNSKSVLENYVYKNYNLEFSINTFAKYIPMVNLMFLPNKPKIFKAHNELYFNTFRENSILATRHDIKDIDRITSLDLNKYPNIKILLTNLFTKKESLEYFINWFSTILNKLEKNRTAIVLKGIQGTGKGLLYDYIISYIFGSAHCITISNEQLKGRFNEELESKIFVIGNEIKGDFRDGNTSYEKLKMYITDDEILIEGKNLKTRKIKNFFNMMIFSNHDTPLQISPHDRRYSVITTNDIKIDELVDDMDIFINNLKKERDNFLKDVIKLKYSKYKASQVLENDDKRLIMEASTPKIELLANWLKKGDMDSIIKEIEDIEEANNKEIANIFNIDLETVNDKKENLFKTLQSEIFEAFEVGYIANRTLFTLYKISVNNTDSTKKMGRNLNTTLGDSILFYSKEKKKTRGRKITIANIPI